MLKKIRCLWLALLCCVSTGSCMKGLSPEDIQVSNDLVKLSRLIDLSTVSPKAAEWLTGSFSQQYSNDWYLLARIDLKNHWPTAFTKEVGVSISIPEQVLAHDLVTSFMQRDGSSEFIYTPASFKKSPLLNGLMAVNSKENVLLIYLFTI